MSGYRIRSYPVEYVGMDGKPFSYVDCLRETRGMAMVSIVAPNGRVVLRDAGSEITRRQFRQSARVRINEARYRRSLSVQTVPPATSDIAGGSV